MAFLTGKKFLITGVISNRSIAYGIAKACHAQGAQLAFSYMDERHAQRVADLAKDFNSDIVLQCDATKDEQITQLFADLAKIWGNFDGFVHSMAFAPKQAIAGDFLEGISRDAFNIAQQTSVYSLAALAKAARPLLNPKAAIVTLSYLGAMKVIPNYNTMGVCKAALESTVRYMAESLGPQGIRVNAISAGPIKTLAAGGIKDFNQLFDAFEKIAPLRRNVTIDDVGNAAAFLLSDLAGGITAEITYVDAGFNQVVGGLS